jgi:hypothetical protein
VLPRITGASASARGIASASTSASANASASSTAAALLLVSSSAAFKRISAREAMAWCNATLGKLLSVAMREGTLPALPPPITASLPFLRDAAAATLLDGSGSGSGSATATATPFNALLERTLFQAESSAIASTAPAGQPGTLQRGMLRGLLVAWALHRCQAHMSAGRFPHAKVDLA